VRTKNEQNLGNVDGTRSPRMHLTGACINCHSAAVVRRQWRRGAGTGTLAQRVHNGPTVFERYSIASRQVIFVARVEAGRVGSPLMDTEHVLLGILQVAPAPPEVFGQPLSVPWVREYVTRWHTPAKKIPTSVDLPIHADTEAVFDKATSLADVYPCKFVRTEHLLLALATVANSHSATILEEAGISLDRLQAMVCGLPLAEEQAGNQSALEDLLNELY
jgi:ATP-dependent Clp protease ATP-binding subunit ClpA